MRRRLEKAAFADLVRSPSVFLAHAAFRAALRRTPEIGAKARGPSCASCQRARRKAPTKGRPRFFFAPEQAHRVRGPAKEVHVLEDIRRSELKKTLDRRALRPVGQVIYLASDASHVDPLLKLAADRVVELEGRPPVRSWRREGWPVSGRYRPISRER